MCMEFLPITAYWIALQFLVNRYRIDELSFLRGLRKSILQKETTKQDLLLEFRLFNIFFHFFTPHFLDYRPLMDIHRCRFSEWMPSAACAMTFHPELPLIVVGRENGDIEIWNTEEKWFCESVCFPSPLLFCREFQVMKTCLFDHLSGLNAFLLPIILCFAIVCSEQVFRDKSLKWI